MNDAGLPSRSDLVPLSLCSGVRPADSVLTWSTPDSPTRPRHAAALILQRRTSGRYFPVTVERGPDHSTSSWSRSEFAQNRYGPMPADFVGRRPSSSNSAWYCTDDGSCSHARSAEPSGPGQPPVRRPARTTTANRRGGRRACAKNFRRTPTPTRTGCVNGGGKPQKDGGRPPRVRHCRDGRTGLAV